MGKPYCKLRVRPELLRLMIEGAADNPNSPCTKGTQAEVGLHAGLAGHQLIGQLCRGERDTCSPTSALGIAGALGVPLEVLFARQMSPLAARSVASRRHKVAS